MAIVVSNNFAELIEILVPEKLVKFEFNLIFNEESLIPGNMADFIIQPKLFINGHLSGLENLENIVVKIDGMNCDGGNTKTEKFENLKLSYEQD